jgi:hypothetical protein
MLVMQTTLILISQLTFAKMLRSLAAFGLITLLFSNVFLKSAILLDFKVNQAVISQTLCIQKDVKENTCNGKCHLSKQLEKSGENSEDTPTLPENLNEMLLFFGCINSPAFTQFAFSQLLIPHVSKLKGINFPNSTFRPPPFVLS